MNASPETSLIQKSGITVPAASPNATETKCTSSVATNTPASTTLALWRVANASATSWVLSPISARKTKNAAIANGAVTQFVVKSPCSQMTRRFAHAILLGLAVVALADAQAPPVRVLASNGVRAVLKDLIPQCERAVGRPLAVEFALSASIKRRIEDNESFDVTILASDVIDALIKEGRLAPRSRAGIGRSGVGVGIRAGAAKPDISTPEAMKQTLLNAKTVTYAEEGASRPVIDRMLQDLGIADRLKPKTKLSRSTDQSMELLF